MSKQAVVEGEFIVREGNGRKEIRFFEEKFIFDDEIGTLENARCVIQNGLLSEKLRKIDGYKNWRTCEVVSFENCEEKPADSELDQLLLKATQLGCIPENIDNYKRSDYKAKALAKAIATAQDRIKRNNKKDEMHEEA